jgi:hypothetical protein
MRVLVAIVVLLVCGAPAMGQAYCAIRDPVTGIFKAFPEATSYRSITQTITPEHREAIASALPFTLHFNELGRHTVYLALKDKSPLGMVHVRSERSRYGLLEIGWVLGVDERVQSAYFQRCRDPRAEAAMESLLPMLKDATFESLQRQLLASTSEDERMLLRSGLKTLSVTWTAWRDAILPFQAWMVANSAFANVDTVQQRPIDVSLFEANLPVDPKGAAAFMVLGDQGHVLGTVVRLDWRPQQTFLNMWWVIGPDQRVRTLLNTKGSQDTTTVALLESIQGKNRRDLETCSTAAGVIGAQLLDALSSENEPSP